MSRLTVTEKEHWKQRIENRINKAIEALETQDAPLMPNIKAKADADAHVFLCTAEIHSKIEANKSQREALEAEFEMLEKAMHTVALGEEAVRSSRGYGTRSDFWHLHAKCSRRIESELLKESSIGREILKLRHEKEALLDTVWLATSNAQIRDLWSRVSVVLRDDATPLQQQIMTTEPDAS